MVLAFLHVLLLYPLKLKGPPNKENFVGINALRPNICIGMVLAQALALLLWHQKLKACLCQESFVGTPVNHQNICIGMNLVLLHVLPP